MVEPKVEDKTKEVDAELSIKKEEEKVSDEKTELQREVEELRKKNQGLEAIAGRVPELNSRIDRFENTMDEKINNLINAKQPTTTGEDTVPIDDDDYLTGKKAKQLIGDAEKSVVGKQEAIVKKVLAEEKGKKTQYDEDYLKEVARLSMDITVNETLQNILGEMDANFRTETGNAKADAKDNYKDAKLAVLTKANAAGQKIEFGSGKPPVAPLGVGNPGGEKIITKPEKEIAVPEDAKELLFSIEKDPEKRKTLAKEALG